VGNPTDKVARFI